MPSLGWLRLEGRDGRRGRAHAGLHLALEEAANPVQVRVVVVSDHDLQPADADLGVHGVQQGGVALRQAHHQLCGAAGRSGPGRHPPPPPQQPWDPPWGSGDPSRSRSRNSAVWKVLHLEMSMALAEAAAWSRGSAVHSWKRASTGRVRLDPWDRSGSASGGPVALSQRSNSSPAGGRDPGTWARLGRGCPSRPAQEATGLEGGPRHGCPSPARLSQAQARDTLYTRPQGRGVGAATPWGGDIPASKPWFWAVGAGSAHPPPPKPRDTYRTFHNIGCHLTQASSHTSSPSSSLGISLQPPPASSLPPSPQTPGAPPWALPEQAPLRQTSLRSADPALGPLSGVS